MRMFIALAVVTGAIVLAMVYDHDPSTFMHFTESATTALRRAWETIVTNPVPVVFGLVTFMATVLYHKAKGKSLRESVEAAATRVTVVSVPVSETEETAVVRRAKARAVRTQLAADQIGLENRQRKLPEEVVKAEKEVCYAEQSLSETRRTLAEREKAHEQAVAKLKALRKERAEGKAELAEIEAHLKKLAEVV